MLKEFNCLKKYGKAVDYYSFAQNFKDIENSFWHKIFPLRGAGFMVIIK